MHRKAILGALLAAATALLGIVVAAPASSQALAPVRVMPLGDSITGSPGCWRSLLWNRLQSTGHTNVDFVGTLGPQGCGQPYDGDNEGHGGALVTAVANQNQLSGWLAAARPDVVLMHFGTNDVWSNVPPATILAAYGKLVDQMRASNPAMRVLVAKIIPMAPGSCGECGARVVALNDAIPGWAAGKTTAASPVVVVDQWTGFNTASDTYDGVHPNASGDQKMSDRWYPALAATLDGGLPSPSPTASPSPTSSPTPPADGGGCVATYRVVGQWTGGFQGEVIVRNAGSVGTTEWTARWTFAGQQITQVWNAATTQSGSAVTARNVGWNGTLHAGTTATFGFLASWTGANPAPAVSCTVT